MKSKIGFIEVGLGSRNSESLNYKSNPALYDFADFKIEKHSSLKMIEFIDTSGKILNEVTVSKSVMS